MSNTLTFPTADELKYVPLVEALVALRQELDFNRHFRTTDRRRQDTYGVLGEQITPEMREFADRFMEFMTSPDDLPERGVAELRDEPGRDWNILELEVVK